MLDKQACRFDVIALNSSTTNNYDLLDQQPLPGLNFYRLKIMDKDGSFRYSPVRRINFNNNGDDVTVYPNPVINAAVFIGSSANTNKAIIFDAAGKMIRTFKLTGRSNTLDLMGIAKGTYQLQVFTENSMHTQKIIIQ